MADQQDRVLGFADELRGLSHLVDVRALVDHAVARGRQRLRQVELFQDDVRRIFDIDRPRRAAERLADAFADDLVGLVGIFDRGGVFHRILEQRHLLDELDAAAAHALFGHAGALAAEEDDRRVFDQAALNGGRGVGDARPERSDADGRLAGDA